MEFDIERFADGPTLEQLDSCSKADLMLIADYFDIDVVRSGTKPAIKAKKVTRVAPAAVLADEFTLTHTSSSVGKAPLRHNNVTPRRESPNSSVGHGLLSLHLTRSADNPPDRSIPLCPFPGLHAGIVTALCIYQPRIWLTAARRVGSRLCSEAAELRNPPGESVGNCGRD
ncbi:hypothetical protein SKAU_G00030320 [Synaphobranchus kaupii]|uniref:Uncharacterized protein n=1 Tax=Synaphobranchus kaupii TaxID=118154 RepID=A0A9Q1GEX4_SYNKA|nr:hypothetical protein SKAU_G00030320 [Synaphobranchus kaupii]